MTEDRAYTILTALRNIKLSISDEMNEQLKPWFDDIEKAIEDEQRAIQALSQEPTECDDAISREAVMGLVAREHTEWDDLYIDIAKLPSVTPTHKHVGSTQQNVGNALDTHCDDTISREDRIIDLANAIESDDSGYWTNKRISSALRNISSVTQKSGKWVDYSDEGYVECPFCGHATNCEDDIDELHYCFYCGAKMEGEE